MAPALLIGNAVVLKPPAREWGISAPAIWRKRLSNRCAGEVLTCVTKDGSWTSAIISKLTQGVDCITFWKFGHPEADSPKSRYEDVGFECGGNNPALVLPDADMNLTAREIIEGARFPMRAALYRHQIYPCTRAPLLDGYYQCYSKEFGESQ